MDLTQQLPPDLVFEQEAIKRKRAIAEMLMQQSMQPLEAPVVKGRFQGAISPFAGAAKMLQAYNAQTGIADADKAGAGIADKYRTGLADAVSNYTRTKAGVPGTPEETFAPLAPNDDEGNAMPAAVKTGVPGVAGDPRRAIVEAMSSPYAPVQRIAQMDMTQLNRTEDRKDTQAFQTSQLEMQIKARAQDIRDKAAEGRITKEESDARMAELRKERLKESSGAKAPKAPVGYRFSADGETLEPIPGGPKAGNTPLPTQALKLQQAELDAIGNASSISRDMQALSKQVDTGALDLGLVSNVINQGRNVVGLSTEQSRNLASFKANLERIRNDSLRLNKGVQTEGDAVRAWNEMLANINDPKVVKQRLAELSELNERAVSLRKMNVDQIRKNYNAQPLDTSGYENQPAAVGDRSAYAGPERRTGGDDPLGLRKPK